MNYDNLLSVPGMSFSRASTAYAMKTSGSYEQYAANIPRITYKGILMEGTATNLVLHSNDLTNAIWDKVRCAALKNAIGPDGVANSACTITATSDQALVRQNLVSPSGSRISSIVMRRKTGSGQVSISQGVTTGSELIVNGGFATDTNWTKGTGWSISGGVATWVPATATYLTSETPIVIGKMYKMTFTITARSGDTATQPYLGGAPALASFNAVGTYTVIGVAVATNLGFSLRGSGTAGSISVDNVSVVEVEQTNINLTNSWTYFHTNAATVLDPPIILRIGTSGDEVEVFNIQNELSAKSTSPIISGSSPGSRSADSLFYTINLEASKDFTISGSAEFTRDTGGTENIIEIDSGTNTNRIRIYRGSGGNIIIDIRALGGSTVTIANPVNKGGARIVNYLIKREGNVYTAFIDGVAFSPTTLSGMLSLTRASIGFGSGGYLNDPFRFLTITPYAVPDAQAIIMTAQV